MSSKYVYELVNATPTAGTNAIVIFSASGKAARLVSISCVGRGTTSAAQGVEIARATGGVAGTSPTTITASKGDGSSLPSAASTVYSNLGTAPTNPTADASGIAVGWNALGGAHVWNAPPGMYYILNGEQIVIRVPSGYTPQACSISVIVEEL